jgi:hypothetical protein
MLARLGIARANMGRRAGRRLLALNTVIVLSPH